MNDLRHCQPIYTVSQSMSDPLCNIQYLLQLYEVYNNEIRHIP